MNRDDVIRLAREVGWIDYDLAEGREMRLVMFAEHFAALVAAAEREAKDELLGALQDLLMDTQHSEHECGDKNCPVSHARRVALKYDTRGQP